MRPNTDISFFDPMKSSDVLPEVMRHYVHTYRNSGKIISSESKLSDDLLTLTTTMVWDKRDSFLDYMCDPIIDDGLMQYSRKHNKSNNIKSSIIDAKDY